MQVKVKLEDAQSTLLSLTMPLPDESVELNQANGRVLHADLLASHSLPEHTQSAVDGFAVHEVDLVRIGQGLASFGLEFYQSLKAGEEPTQPLAPGRVMRVVTGGRVPNLTAGVIAEEQVRVQGERVFIDRPAPPAAT